MLADFKGNFLQMGLEQINANLERLGFGCEYRDVFYELSTQESLECVSTDVRLSEILVTLGARVHHFERNKNLKNILEKQFKNESGIEFYFKVISNKNGKIEESKYNQGRGFLPVNGKMKDCIEYVDIDEFDLFKRELYLFYMDLNFYNYKLLESLSQKNIRFIFLKVDDCFVQSETFKKLQEKYRKIRFIF